ncbi:MAG: hypothetical protein KC502_14210 [Myxococcales bacterium]|nr:hypothetical protein [Myxococcales bacterium]
MSSTTKALRSSPHLNWAGGWLMVVVFMAGCGATSTQQDQSGAETRVVPTEPDLRMFRMTPARNKPHFSLAVRMPQLASQLAVLESCIRAHRRAAAPGCRPLRSRLNEEGRTHLRAFERARRRFLQARAARPPQRDPAHPLAASLLPPAALQASEAFAEPFYRFAKLDTALADLQLPPADKAALKGAFLWFQAPLDALFRRLMHNRPDVALAQVAKAARLDTFLAQLARFYGVTAQMPRKLSVDLVWSARDRVRATAWAGRAVVPINRHTFPHQEGTACEPPRICPPARYATGALLRTLGVVVHEFGHVFLSRLSHARRVALTDRIAGQAGVLNRRHANVLDEAIQTAAGNVLFVRSAAKWTPLSPTLYAFEPGYRWPAAIDRLSRHLVPVLADHIGHNNAFDGPFIDRAIARHIQVFGRSPVAFARACVVVTNQSRLGHWFRQLMPGLSRTVVGTDGQARATDWVVSNPWLTRWLLEVQTAGAQPSSGNAAAKSTQKLDNPALDAARKCVTQGHAACFIAHKRGAAAGWDLALAARFETDMRRLLMRLVHARSFAQIRLPLAKPITPPGS